MLAALERSAPSIFGAKTMRKFILVLALSIFPLFSSAQTTGGVIYATNYGVLCNGTADDTAGINSAIAAASNGNTVQLPGASAICKISSTIVIPSGVTLAGAGLSQALPLDTAPAPTKLLWAGANNVAIITCRTGSYDCGLRDILIDGQATAPFTAVGPYCVTVGAVMGAHIENVGCQNVGWGFLFQNDGAGGSDYFEWGHFSNLRVLNSYNAFYFDGQTNGAVTNTNLYDLFAWNFYGTGITLTASLDDVKLHGEYLSTTQSGAVGIYINPANTSNGPAAANIIDNLTMDVFAPATTIVCNQTGGIYNVIKGQLFGGSINEPVINPGCLLDLDVMNVGAMPMVQSIYPIWSNPAMTAGASTSYGMLDGSAFTLFNPGAYSNLFHRNAGPIVKVDWVTVWVPQSSTGSIRLFDPTNSTNIATVTPGTMGQAETTIDITAYVMAHWVSGEYEPILETAGNGAVGPTIYKSFLRVTTLAY